MKGARRVTAAAVTVRPACIRGAVSLGAITWLNAIHMLGPSHSQGLTRSRSVPRRAWTLFASGATYCATAHSTTHSVAAFDLAHKLGVRVPPMRWRGSTGSQHAPIGVRRTFSLTGRSPLLRPPILGCSRNASCQSSLLSQHVATRQPFPAQRRCRKRALCRCLDSLDRSGQPQFVGRHSGLQRESTLRAERAYCDTKAGGTPALPRLLRWSGNGSSSALGTAYLRRRTAIVASGTVGGGIAVPSRCPERRDSDPPAQEGAKRSWPRAIVEAPACGVRASDDASRANRL